MLLLATILIVAIGFAHSFLGERYILIRLFRQPLPKLFGSDVFTRRTLRFAWHITTVAWLGFGTILLLIHGDQMTRANVLITTGAVFGVSAIIALIASSGKHLSWLVFGAISVACFLSA